MDDWSTRPRVLTYLRKGKGLKAEQARPLQPDDTAQRDLLFLNLATPTGGPMTIINVYNAPPGSRGQGEAVRALTELPRNSIGRSIFLAGDLNMHHGRWQTSFNGSNHPAEALLDWTDSTGLSLISYPDVPTHKRGNVLDLAFASEQLARTGATTETCTHLDVTSDHIPLLTLIPGEFQQCRQTGRLRPDTIEEGKFFRLLKGNLATTPVLAPNPTTDELDETALALTNSISGAYRNSAERTMGSGIGQPWWNEECRTAVQRHRWTRRDGSDPNRLEETKRNLKVTTQRAKRLFYQAKLDGATTDKEVFRMAGWHKSRGSYRSPPLVDPRNPGSRLAVTPAAKREVLIRNLLQNVAEAGDIQMDAPAVAKAALPFPAITEAEIDKAIIGAKNSAPGADETPTVILRLAWPLIKERVSTLFRACLDIGHHPTCFRSAIILMLDKPDKTDLSNPRAYRPIALLSVLGKGLERLIAKRLSWVAVKHKVLAPQHFGPLPLRSAVDLTTCLAHDVEEALNQKLTASLLTVDIKGAFDTVLPGRLVRRMREQGWPEAIVRWTASFATGRSVQIHLDGELGPPAAIECGLPQGSPVSPILFALYIAPLLWMGRSKKRFGYADDLGFLEISNSLGQSAEKLSSHLQEALDWGHAEGITFDPTKSELKHFSRRHADKNPSTRPTVTSTAFTVTEDQKKPYLRWLGVRFDRCLTYKWHVKAQSEKALKVATALRSLANSVRGVKADLLRKTTTACVLPVAYYAAETWWPGRTRPGTTQAISNRVDHLIQTLTKVTLTAARAILPVWKTTPVAVLHRESGVSPPELALNSMALAAATRLKRLDPRHPLRRRAEKIQSSGRPTSRFARRVLALPQSEQIDPILDPPWELGDREMSNVRIHGPQGRSKDEVSEEFQAWASNVTCLDIVLYSDGSKLQNGATGAGYVAYQGAAELTRRAIPLGTKAEVFDAEAIAALAGIEAALTLPTAAYAANLWICLDNLEVALHLGASFPGTSQGVFDCFIKATRAWKTRPRAACSRPGEVKIRWVPGHAQIKGNEIADRIAKEGAAMNYPGESIYTLAALRRWAKSRAPEAMGTLWETVAPSSYKELYITTSLPSEA